MRINNNVAAFNAYRNLSNTNVNMGKSLEKLSSGFRINRAADDAAGLTRSEGLRAEIGGTKVAIRNAQDGISFVQTAEGALDEVHGILQRMRDLAVSAANATSDGTAEQAEMTELKAELTAIGDKTTFNGAKVFGVDNDQTFHVGAGSGAANQIVVQGYDLADSALGKADISVAGVDLAATNGSGVKSAVGGIALIDSAIASVSKQRSDLGAVQNRLESSIRNLSVTAENLTAAESRIRDTDMAEEMTRFTRNQVLQQAGTAMLAQANQVPQSVLSLLR